MLTPTNQLSGLYLHLGPENSPAYKVECEGCEGKGRRLEDVPPYYGACAMKDCWQCHGTGQRTVRLVGVVEGVYADVEMGTIYWSVKGYNRYGPTWEALAETIIEDYRAGTLPEAVRAGLKEVDAE